MDPATVSIAIGLAVAAAGAQAAQARMRNQAIEKSMASAQEAAAAQASQLADQTALERQKGINRAEQVEGRLRVAATTSGAAFDGSFAALSTQNLRDAQLDDLILQRNFANNMARVLSGLDAQQAGLEGQGSNLLLSAFSGGLQGAQAGIAIGGAFSSSPGAGGARGPNRADGFVPTSRGGGFAGPQTGIAIA